MRILIIGGTGNISKWFTQQLAERGDDIVLYNRGTKQIPFNGKVKYITGDRTDYKIFSKQVQDAGMFDCVIDMVGYEVEDAMQSVRLFSGNTAQYIFCSTVDVYSKQQLAYPVPLKQTINASPTFPYAYKKMQMEKRGQSALYSTGYSLYKTKVQYKIIVRAPCSKNKFILGIACAFFLYYVLYCFMW